MKLKDPPLNRDVIKLIAIFAMALNHYAYIVGTGSKALDTLFTAIGIFTLPVMVYFLVEGYEYTRSRKKYLLRLFVFSLLSLVPFWLASRSWNFSVITTLTVCFLLLLCRDHIKNAFLRLLCYTFLTLFTLRCDWPVMACVFTLILASRREDGKSVFGSYCILSGVFIVLDVLLCEPDFSLTSFLNAAYGAVSVLTAGFVLAFLYNGQPSKKARGFSKWFFYVFYPAHLLLLTALRGLIR